MTTENPRIDDIISVQQICMQIEKLSDNDLDRLCWLIDGEHLARKERLKNDTSTKPA